jgi:DNA-binding NarL/FixJ family response regulator
MAYVSPVVRSGAAAPLPRRAWATQEITERFELSVRTVQTHPAHAYDELGINSRAALREALDEER